MAAHDQSDFEGLAALTAQVRELEDENAASRNAGSRRPRRSKPDRSVAPRSDIAAGVGQLSQGGRTGCFAKRAARRGGALRAAGLGSRAWPMTAGAFASTTRKRRPAPHPRTQRLDRRSLRGQGGRQQRRRARPRGLDDRLRTLPGLGDAQAGDRAPRRNRGGYDQGRGRNIRHLHRVRAAHRRGAPRGPAVRGSVRDLRERSTTMRAARAHLARALRVGLRDRR